MTIAAIYSEYTVLYNTYCSILWHDRLALKVSHAVSMPYHICILKGKIMNVDLLCHYGILL